MSTRAALQSQPNRFSGHPRATAEMLRACAILEDDGVLGEEAEKRIAALSS